MQASPQRIDRRTDQYTFHHASHSTFNDTFNDTLYDTLYDTLHRVRHQVACACVVSALLAGSAAAQNPAPRIRVMEAPSAMTFALSAPNRAVMGVALATGALADTLGLEITDVTPNGPAALAGLKTGSRIQAVNGVSLRISEADARDPLTADAGYRRLQRELGKLEPGDTVTLSVLESGERRRVSLVTQSAASLTTGRTLSAVAQTRELVGSRAALGMRVSSAGNARDTLGVFITSVATGGPVETAGVIEGDRVAAINGVDVRVPREDTVDPRAASARVARFSREVAKLEPGEQVLLRVFSNRRFRDVTVTAGKASDFGPSVFRLDTEPGVELFWRAPASVPAMPPAMPPAVAPQSPQQPALPSAGPTPM